jgi:hypothetical protein
VSGSPKHAVVVVDAAALARQAAQNARRAEQRAREAEERRRREAELARIALAEHRRTMALRLESLLALAGQARAEAQRAAVPVPQALEEQLETMTRSVPQSVVAQRSEILARLERARAALTEVRTIAAVARGHQARALIPVALRECLAAADPDGLAALAEQTWEAGHLLSRLEGAAAEEETDRFDALRGTVEQKVRRLCEAADETGERLRTERAALAEARRRLAAAAERAEAAALDADSLGRAEWAARLRGAVVAARRTADVAPDCAAAAAGLDAASADTERQLDELVAAAQRRASLAQALREAMGRQGMQFLGGTERGRQLVLRFERGNGAVYVATIGDGAQQDESMVAYTVAGEQDVAAAQESGEAVCDQTGELLETVHDGLAEHGFVADELTWDHKPPGSAAKPSARRVLLQQAAQRRRHREVQ